MYLLDTNICSYLMRGTFPGLAKKVLSIPPSELAVSSLTVFELEYGASKKGWGINLLNKMHLMLSAFTVIPFEEQDAITAGEIRAYLANAGAQIGVYDLLIAAQGVSRDMVVVTHNTREFIRVPNIKLEDWVI